ncbi:MAG: hypothetical protein LUF04_01550 [Bacteroides sp.]|nr:hypothetical protein [Bacteroides sp.]
MLFSITFSACKERKRATDEFLKKDNATENTTIPEGYVMVWHEEFDTPRLFGGRPALHDTNR